MKITVTQSDIALGREGKGVLCPVARALCRSLHLPLGNAVVSHDGMCIAYEPRLRTPKKVREFISRFDSGLPVKPFTFQLSKKYEKPILPFSAEMAESILQYDPGTDPGAQLLSIVVKAQLLSSASG